MQFLFKSFWCSDQLNKQTPYPARFNLRVWQLWSINWQWQYGEGGCCGGANIFSVSDGMRWGLGWPHGSSTGRGGCRTQLLWVYGLCSGIDNHISISLLSYTMNMEINILYCTRCGDLSSVSPQTFEQLNINLTIQKSSIQALQATILSQTVIITKVNQFHCTVFSWRN